MFCDTIEPSLIVDDKSYFKIGVVGYSAQSFSVSKANHLMDLTFALYKQMYGPRIAIVSGLTNLGIPAIAYQYAKRHDFKTVGIACSKAFDYECYPVDERHIVGNQWGEESRTFLSSLDILVRIGGGKQTQEEVELFRVLYPHKIIIGFDL